jgi:hypothetical protein
MMAFYRMVRLEWVVQHNRREQSIGLSRNLRAGDRRDRPDRFGEDVAEQPVEHGNSAGGIALGRVGVRRDQRSRLQPHSAD